MSFADLKRNRAANIEKLQGELNKMSGGRQADDRFWKPEVDKAGNGYAVVRFLPAPEGEDVPWVQVFDHAFQGPGGWYIEKSLTTLGQKDPLTEYNSMLWNSGIDANKDQARKQKRRKSFYANIYIVKDPANPDNEGKVFLYKFGQKIFDKIQEKINPEFEDETSLDPFDLWEGADFKIKIRKVEGYQNYDKSEFADPAPLSESDDELEAVWNQEYSLQEFISPESFKSFEALESRMNAVLKLNVPAGTEAPTASAAEYVEAQAPALPEATQDDPPFDPDPPKSTAESDFEADDEDDEQTLSFFQKLAEE